MDGLAGLVLQIEVEHGVLQGTSSQKFQGQIVDTFGALVAVALLSTQPIVHQAPTHRQGQAMVLVVGLSPIRFSSEGKTQG